MRLFAFAIGATTAAPDNPDMASVAPYSCRHRSDTNQSNKPAEVSLNKNDNKIKKQATKKNQKNVDIPSKSSPPFTVRNNHEDVPTKSFSLSYTNLATEPPVSDDVKVLGNELSSAALPLAMKRIVAAPLPPILVSQVKVAGGIPPALAAPAVLPPPPRPDKYAAGTGPPLSSTFAVPGPGVVKLPTHPPIQQHAFRINVATVVGARDLTPSASKSGIKMLVELVTCIATFFLAHSPSCGSSSIGLFIGGSIVSAVSIDSFKESEHGVGSDGQVGEVGVNSELSEEQETLNKDANVFPGAGVLVEETRDKMQGRVSPGLLRRSSVSGHQEIIDQGFTDIFEAEGYLHMDTNGDDLTVIKKSDAGVLETGISSIGDMAGLPGDISDSLASNAIPNQVSVESKVQLSDEEILADNPELASLFEVLNDKAKYAEWEKEEMPKLLAEIEAAKKRSSAKQKKWARKALISSEITSCGRATKGKDEPYQPYCHEWIGWTCIRHWECYDKKEK